MLSLIQIITACLLGGMASMALAAWLAYKLPPSILGRMVAFAAGAMLAAALLDVLPEAFALGPGQHEALFTTLLAALVGFYLLERAALWRHAHPDHEPVEGHGLPSKGAAWVALLGDGVHNFVDGVLIAAAFLSDPWLGITTTLAVVAHEIPQELGDFVLLLSAGWSRRGALVANGLSSLSSVAGGVLGWWLLEDARHLLPFALTVAAASFLYIAVADLMPLLHRRRSVDGFVSQFTLMTAGLICIPLVGRWLH